MRGRRLRAVMIIIVAAVVSAVTVFLLYINGDFLPKWIYWEEKEDTMNAGEAYVRLDGKKVEVYITQDGVDDTGKRVYITQEGVDDTEKQVYIIQNAPIWSTDKSIKAQSFYVCDLDYNGFDELLVLCWKKGRYGDTKPFWVEKDGKTFVQHIYIYELRNGKVSPKWMTSELGRTVREWEIIDGHYILLRDIDGDETLWEWKSYGLKEAG